MLQQKFPSSSSRHFGPSSPLYRRSSLFHVQSLFGLNTHISFKMSKQRTPSSSLSNEPDPKELLLSSPSSIRAQPLSDAPSYNNDTPTVASNDLSPLSHPAQPSASSTHSFALDMAQPLLPQLHQHAQALLLEIRRNPVFVRSLILGQFLSFLLAVMGVSSESLANKGVDLPTFQGVLNYVLLATVYGGQMLYERVRPCQDLWKYALLAFLDVEANFLLVKAYQFTSITSVTLLDSFTIPAVILLSRIFLHARYSRGHYAGATVSLFGLALLVISDHASSTAGAPHPLLGDALVILGAMLYAVSNVAQEKLLTQDVPVRELLGYLGAFGAAIGLVQAGIFEGSRIAATHWGHGTTLPFLAFSTALFAFYSLVPKVLVHGGATALNLSLLTSDVWAALARVVLFDGFSPHSAALFVIAFLFVAVGLVVYTLAGPVRSEPTSTAGQGGTGRSLEEKAAHGAPGDASYRGEFSEVHSQPDSTRGTDLGGGVAAGSNSNLPPQVVHHSPLLSALSNGPVPPMGSPEKDVEMGATPPAPAPRRHEA